MGKFEDMAELSEFETHSNDIMVLNFNAFDTIYLEDEVMGESESLLEFAVISGILNRPMFCGIITEIADLKHISVAVCNKGRLVDIVDRTSNPFNDEYEESQKIKVFATELGRVTLLIDNDLLVEKNWQKTVEYSDVVLGILKGDDENVLELAEEMAKKYDVKYIFVNDTTIRWKE